MRAISIAHIFFCSSFPITRIIAVLIPDARYLLTPASADVKVEHPRARMRIIQYITAQANIKNFLYNCLQQPLTGTI